MDVHDVWGEEYSQMLLRQKEMLQRAQQRRGQRPRDWKSRDEMYIDFMMVIMTNDLRAKRGDRMVNTSFIPPSYLPCNTPLAELQRVNIKDLQLETHHRGTYLIVRAIAPPNRMTGILVLVEDECGQTVILQIYQQDDETTRAAHDIVNVGTIMIIKEPFFKVMASGEYGLRVDHLSDIIEVSEHDPIRPLQWRPRIMEAELSIDILKKKGNEAVAEGKYWRAIAQYNAAILQKHTASKALIVKRNRALAFLKTKQFDAALSDTNFPEFGPLPSEKALFRAAEALYQLQRFREARQVLETLHDSFPGNTKATEVLERVSTRCAEQVDGIYDFKRLQAAAKRSRPPQLDHATYIGPIETRQVPNKGRGLFVTRAVRAGDLLLCEKAFGYAWIDEQPETHSDSTFLINVETDRIFAGGHADLITKLVQKLYRNPSLGPMFRSLYHGDYTSVDSFTVDGKPVVDTFLIERIMSYNVFGCPDSSLNTYKDELASTSRKTRSFGSCGIWVQASYLNHSCVSNVRRSFIGDMMIIRAARDLEAGSELTFWYQIPDGTSFEKLQEKLKQWKFVCDCAMCNDAKKTKATVVAERKRLNAQMEKLAQLRTIPTEKFERLLEALNATYIRPATDVPRLLLWAPQLLLIRTYTERSNVTKSLEWTSKVLASLGFVVVGANSSSTTFEIERWGLVLNHVVEIFLHARTAFEALGCPNDSKQAAEYAKVAYKIVVGENSSFESVHGA